MIDKPGVYTDYDVAAYYADPCPEPSLTQSIAKVLLDKSPLHAWCEHPRLGREESEPEEYKAERVIGDAAHGMLIGRGKDIEIASFDDWRKADARAFRDKVMAAGRVPILQKHFARAMTIELQARKNLSLIDGCAGAFKDGAGEVVVAAQIDGVWCRSLIDWMQDTTLLYDLKTTGTNIAPHLLPFKMVDDGWDVQAAMQESILDAIDPDNAGRRRFRFVAIENDEPHALVVAELPESALVMGRKKLAMARTIWADCLRTDRWPGFPPMIMRPSYPEFKERQWLDRELEHAERWESEFNPELLMAG